MLVQGVEKVIMAVGRFIVYGGVKLLAVTIDIYV